MENIGNTLSFNLFARPSFTEGVARIVDFSGSLQVYNHSRNGKEADLKALRGDWQMVGRDLKSSMDLHGKKE